ncbi:hypothetical protein KTS45_11115 [Halomicroarcula limicola]|uniref:Uncharacterized protein n=1 Tax=Haloarcula limicola TaxID=1429915 RepID=A0A8J8C511_9EURY|nr:hypothetical protein [Halomicroarcula limicola]MBV0924749.1 hypothetical protein [Halomicroarcula limicola]
MSINTSGSTPEVSSHALQRYIQRSDSPMVTAADLSYRFATGLRVEIEGKNYTEARLTQESGIPLVLLRQHSHVATVVYARGETVLFTDASPTLECRKCGMKEPGADGTATCTECKANDWMLIDPPL